MEPAVIDVFNEIEKVLKEKYMNWKLLKNKHYEVKGYKQAYLDVKKIRRRLLNKEIETK